MPYYLKSKKKIYSNQVIKSNCINLLKNSKFLFLLLEKNINNLIIHKITICP